MANIPNIIKQVGEVGAKTQKLEKRLRNLHMEIPKTERELDQTRARHKRNTEMHTGAILQSAWAELSNPENITFSSAGKSKKSAVVGSGPVQLHLSYGTRPYYGGIEWQMKLVLIHDGEEVLLHYKKQSGDKTANDDERCRWEMWKYLAHFGNSLNCPLAVGLLEEDQIKTLSKRLKAARKATEAKDRDVRERAILEEAKLDHQIRAQRSVRNLYKRRLKAQRHVNDLKQIPNIIMATKALTPKGTTGDMWEICFQHADLIFECTVTRHQKYYTRETANWKITDSEGKRIVGQPELYIRTYYGYSYSHKKTTKINEPEIIKQLTEAVKESIKRYCARLAV